MMVEKTNVAFLVMGSASITTLSGKWAMAISKMPEIPPGMLWMATSPPETMAAIIRISFMMLIHAGARMPATAI